MNKDIYEIYRACRLCGVGAGYKMPIIQSIVDVEDEEIELKQKIRECVQIEVNLNDRMPPLICELCIDKIQDFFEFRKMCLETNKTTRLRLGLPLQMLQKTAEPDCILGVTEPLNSDSDEAEPLVKQATRKPRPKSKAKKEPETDVKIEIESQPIFVVDSRSPSPEVERRELRRKRPPSPKRVTRQNKTEDMLLTGLENVEITKSSLRARPGPKSVLNARERQKEAQKESTDDEDDNALLVPRQKRPREFIVEMPPPSLKKTRLSSEPAKLEKTYKPGPKSSKEIPKPTPPSKPPTKAGPKSKKREVSPAFKSQKYDPPPVPPKSKKSESQESAPKSRKSDVPLAALRSKPEASKSKSRREISPLPAAKSKKVESSSIPPSKVKKRDASTPGPKSKQQPEASPKAPEKDRASFLGCNICGAKFKTVQGQSSHKKTHTPTFTTTKLACNACELWFPSFEAANSHHRRHDTMSLPYTCPKCYDDFMTPNEYEMHFTLNQCLPTYEVPDVKCEECWKMFPTYKLLEDHKCPGEGGRPGGKCPKCNRTYATLKALTTHEMRCTVKKKTEPEVETDSSPDMLPMQVRIVRCDSLLTSHRGHYDIKGLSRKFGLDRSCTYPYFSMVDVKSETTLDYMVSIRDEIKQEYLTSQDDKDENMVHWDSDNESDDDASSSNKSANSLSTISLKTLFSSKCLGKVPRKKRKLKSEIDSDSILDDDSQVDTRTNINNIINNLAKDFNNSDSYDSDSILDKKDRKDNVGLFDNSNTKLTEIANTADETKEINKPDEEPNRTDNDIDRICNNEIAEDADLDKLDSKKDDTNDQTNSSSQDEEIDKQVNENLNEVTNSSQNDADNSENANLNRLETNNQDNDNDQSTCGSHNEEYDKQVNDNLNEVTNDSQTKFDDTKPELLQKFSNCSKTTKNNDPSTTDDERSQNNDNYRSSPKNGHIVINKIVNEDESLSIEDKAENKNAQIALENVDFHQKEPEINCENISKLVDSSDIEISEQTKKKPLNNSKNEEDTNVDSKSSETSNIIEDVNVESQSYHETDDNINEKDDSTYATNDETNDNCNSLSAANDETNEKDDSPYTKNDNVNEKDDSTNHSYIKNSCPQNNPTDTDDPFSKSDEIKNQDAESNFVDSKESLITENELFENERVQNDEKFNINYLDDEDKLLMAEIDAQIGENQPDSNIGANEPHSEVFSENRNVIGENSAVIRENSDVKTENSHVISENGEPSRNYCPVGISNEGFSEEKNDTLEVLINKQNDLKSLDLDTISDEEFNFDI